MCGGSTLSKWIALVVGLVWIAYFLVHDAHSSGSSGTFLPVMSGQLGELLVSSNVFFRNLKALNPFCDHSGIFGVGSTTSWTNPSILIVGGTSLLGIHLAATLQYSGVSVTVAERLPLLKVKLCQK